ncbi:MAG: ankyrin repeat domain-containing protein [Gammaproteobacteria bacterium]|nr:ankyrin repeat domain-containing protein [Gammaproteobacteria bacterium]
MITPSTPTLRTMMLLLALAGAIPAHAADATLANLIQAGDREAALDLIRTGDGINVAQQNGTTPLHWAVYNVDRELVEALIKRGARADVRNGYGSSPLAEAVKLGDVAMVKLLLKAGANANDANEDGQTALMLAARTGVVPVGEELIKAGADVNHVEAWRGQTALMWAVGSNHPEFTRLLIKHGADVSKRAKVNDWDNQITNEPRAQYRPTGGLTPLLYAARSGCDDCVAAILDAGADINLPNPDGVSPLMIAIDNFHYDTAALLLERGANPHVWDWWGRTPLYVAIDMNSFVTRRGATPADGGSSLTALDIARKLLQAGVNVNPQLLMHRPGRGGNSGRFTDDPLTTGATPLLVAAMSHDVDAVKLLLEFGAEVDRPNIMGLTPLMVASGMATSVRDVRGNHSPGESVRAIATLEVLLAAGADINARVTDIDSRTARIARPSTLTERLGQTALFGAIKWGWTDTVQFLLAHGASVDIADANGMTPLDQALGKTGGRDNIISEEIASLLRDPPAQTSSGS